VTVLGPFVASNDATFSNNILVGSALNVRSNAAFSNAVTVLGTFVTSNDATFSNDVLIGSTLTVSSNAAFSNIVALPYLLMNPKVIPSSNSPNNAILYLDVADSYLKCYQNSIAAPVQPVKVKGDLVTHNGTMPVRLPVGSNEWVLTGDSAAANGIGWNINFGMEFIYVESLTNTVFSSTAYVTKLTLTTDSLQGGYYMINAKYVISFASANKDGEIQILLDGSTILHDNIVSMARTTNTLIIADWFRVNLTAGVHTVLIQGKYISASVNITMKNAQIALWRCI
jgi:hypothetical protein